MENNYMKKIIFALVLLCALDNSLEGLLVNICQPATERKEYDAVLLVLNDKQYDDTQKTWLKEFCGDDGVLAFEQMIEARAKPVGNFWVPQKGGKLITWASLLLLQKKASQDEILEELRCCLGKALTALEEEKIKSVAIILPDALGVLVGGWDVALREITIVAHLATYLFSYATTKPQNSTLQCIDLVRSEGTINEPAVNIGNIIGRYTNLARQWGDEAPGRLLPQKWAQLVKHEAKLAGCSYKALDIKKIRSLGMGGVLGVHAGASKAGPVVMVLEYAPKNPAGTVALVGKGVIFDSGGLHMKSRENIHHMKFDKCGGAAALAACLAAASLKLPMRVIAIVPAVLNKTGSNAQHPRDIVRMMNGKTVEINNTDAEGRLILADGLHYAEKFYKPDVLIDIATLTGSCRQALGFGYSGLMSRHDRLKGKLIMAGKRSGDYLWELPLTKMYQTGNDSDVADISNSAEKSYGAGAIMAGLFLESFVQSSCWAHLDIAGPYAQVPYSWFGSKGATGFGVRLLVDFITNYEVDNNGVA